MKKIIVMVGAPGSGKTTWINNYLNKTTDKFTIISTDDLIEEEAERLDKTYRDIWKTFYKKAEKISQRKFKDAIVNGNNIIYDQTNWTMEKRKGLIDKVGDDYYKIAVYFVVPLETLQDRVKKRGEITGKIIPPQVVADMYKKLDEPSHEEGFDEIMLMGEETQFLPV